jgi:hypothetical protein
MFFRIVTRFLLSLFIVPPNAISFIPPLGGSVCIRRCYVEAYIKEGKETKVYIDPCCEVKALKYAVQYNKNHTVALSILV